MPLDLPINYANEKLPAVTKGLIMWLKEVYPDRMPESNITMDELRFKQGQIAVVKTLESVYEDQ
jgi:hypothetical protein